MASSRILDPVLHCTPKDFMAVSALSQRMLSTGIYANTATFVTPVVLVTVMKPADALLTLLIGEAKTDSNRKKERNKQSYIVFALLEQLLLYAKPICNHNIVIINLSGFDCNNQPEDMPVPPQPIITKVTEGTVPGTYKASLLRTKNKPGVAKASKTHQKNISYSVEVSTTPDDPNSWVLVLEGVSSINLVFSGLTPNIKNYIRVYGVTRSKGKGQPSIPYPYTPQ